MKGAKTTVQWRDVIYLTNGRLKHSAVTNLKTSKSVIVEIGYSAPKEPKSRNQTLS